MTSWIRSCGRGGLGQPWLERQERELEMQARDEGKTLALDGVKVLDLSRLVAGNMLTLVLADFGAEVVKVEQPGTGDPLRAWRAAGQSVHWKVYSRNKKSVTLDLSQASGRELLLRLLEGTDVLVESFVPGKLEAWGLDPEYLLSLFPRLLVVRISGWGQTGPYSTRPGFGTLVEAVSGFAQMNTVDGETPVLPPIALADMVAGVYGAFATVTAVRSIEVGAGAGQVIDLSLLESLVSILGPERAISDVAGGSEGRIGSRSKTAAPRNLYRAADGLWLAISATTQAMTERLFSAIGRPDMSLDERFDTNTARLANVEELDAGIQAFVGARTLKENLSAFEAAGVTAAPVLDAAQLAHDRHVVDRQVFVEVPDGDLGSIFTHAPVPRLSSTPATIRSPAPALGEHNREVLARIGVSESELAELSGRGVI